VIHNAGIGYREPRRVDAEPSVPSVFAVNVLAAYILTALIERPDRLVYESSGMHHSVRPRMDDLLWMKRSWSGASAYAECKLCDVLLAFAVARRWPNLLSNALEPAWVPTKMGGPSAPGDIAKAHLTQAWLATSDDPWRGRPANIFTIRSFASPIPSLGLRVVPQIRRQRRRIRADFAS
jgi:NAD(P)-dependent dehydrogenase (short-subunit alcohol dehydrogenase family)